MKPFLVYCHIIFLIIWTEVNKIYPKCTLFLPILLVGFCVYFIFEHVLVWFVDRGWHFSQIETFWHQRLSRGISCQIHQYRYSPVESLIGSYCHIRDQRQHFIFMDMLLLCFRVSLFQLPFQKHSSTAVDWHNTKPNWINLATETA